MINFALFIIIKTFNLDLQISNAKASPPTYCSGLLHQNGRCKIQLNGSHSEWLFSHTHMPLPCITYIISAKCPGLFYFRASSTASAQCFAIASVKRKSCWDAEWHISQLCMCCKGFVEDLDWHSSEVWIGFNWKYRWSHRNKQKTFIFVIKK